jgi:hypothetical protein
MMAQAINQLAQAQSESLDLQRQTLAALEDLSRGKTPEEKAAESKRQRQEYSSQEASMSDQAIVDASPIVELWNASPEPKIVGFGLAKKYTLRPGKNEVPEVIARVYTQAMQGKAEDEVRRLRMANKLLSKEQMDQVLQEGR